MVGTCRHCLVMIIDHDRKGNNVGFVSFLFVLAGIRKKIRELTQLLLCFGCLGVFTDPDFQFNK